VETELKDTPRYSSDLWDALAIHSAWGFWKAEQMTMSVTRGQEFIRRNFTPSPTSRAVHAAIADADHLKLYSFAKPVSFIG
jgi:hypothetical protein